MRMGTRPQYHTCSHVNSPNLSVARGSHLLPLLAQDTQAAGPREKNLHAEAVIPLS